MRRAGDADSTVANYVICTHFPAIQFFICTAVGAQRRAFKRDTGKEVSVVFWPSVLVDQFG